ncbi:pectin lyase-like superfamily protein [Actinidia rufa]|uniref:Pectin lyase-like superfamily protein n=1 Tax=Actinidia rufa TaxID=165716 RepID=A0A7J0D9Z4_9ERIC|nr:pectin lyase-like superfamily protein [Actinidia rufa]
MIIPMVAEYGEHVSIKFICRYPHRRNGDVMIYKKLPINDDRTLQNALNIPSRHPDHQHVEIYVVKEEVSTMNTSGSHTAVGWTDVHTYGELLSRRGDLSTLGSFTQMLALGRWKCGSCGTPSCLRRDWTQDNEDADVFQSDNSDEDIDVLLTNEANDDFDDDGREDLNVGEALHDNSHIPFFTNLVGADDVVGGRDLYDDCPTWSDVTPEFAKRMVFKDKDAVIRAYPGWKIASIVENVKNHSGFTVSYKKAWLGRTKAIAMVFGDWDSSYEKLPRFMRTLELRNPGTSVILETLDLVIGIDGTFLYGKYTGVMLIAMAKTVTNNIFPLAFALVESENYRDWSWFIHNIRHLIVPGIEGVTLISNRHAAIISAVKHEWETARLGQPIGIHRYCLRHFRSNYQKKFGNVKVKDLVWKAGTAHQVCKFDEAMDEIKKLGMNSESAARAYRALCNEDPRKWTLAHDGGYRWGVTTTNDSECYNNVLRGARDLPITSCVEVTFYRLVATFNDKRRQIESALAKGLRYTSKVQAKLEEYQARSAGHHVTICNWASGSAEVVTSAAGTTGNNKHAVYLNPPSCDCGKWMIYHYPCSHMLAVCAKSGRQPWHLIDPKYKLDVYAHVYNTSFEPMVHEHYWAAYDGPMDNVGSPGPIDGTVLTLQAHHRSTWIWEHGGTDALACRRYGSGLYDRELDPRVLQYVLRAGFYGVYRLGPIRLDHALITTFVERWRPETHTFHLPVGEASITLQDVAILLGLPVDEEIDSGRLRMSWLRRTFDILPEHADDVSGQRHTRACSWGSAVLAMLYRSMCRAMKTGQRQIAGALLLLQIWACERFPRMCPHRVDDHTVGQQPLLIGGMHFPGGPWGARWRSRFRTTTTSTHVIRVYRDQLDRLRPNEFTWRPYDGIMHELPDYCRVASDIWVSRSPLVCFEVVEWHLPDLVCRQFGLRQVVPVAVDTSPALHGIDMRGRTHTDWTQFHREHIDHWHHRHEYLVVGVIDAAAMRYDDPYMVWYRLITRTLVGNPAHRPTSGYVEIGSTIEIATRYIAAIHDRIDRAIYSYDRPESLQDMYDARDMCSRSLHALLHPPPSTSSSQQFTQYVGATQTSASYVTPAMPSYTYHILSHDVPSSSRPSSSGVRPRRTTHRHITSPVTYDQGSSYLPVGDEEEFDGYVDPLLASTGQIEIPISMPKRKGNFGASSSRSVPSDEMVGNQSSAIHVVHTYTDPDDDKCIRFSWEDLFDKRCEQEMYCRWHGLRVPKARSATLFGRGSPNSQVIKALEREIDEMQRRLDRYHFTEYAKKECADPTQRIIEINVDPLLVSDPELSDFSEEEGDDNFVNYLPSSISVAVILGSVNSDDWPVSDPLPSYGQGDNGAIDGQGSVWWNWFRNETLDYNRPYLVEFHWSVISNLTFLNSPFSTIHPVYCSSGIALGSEMSGGISEVHAENLQFFNSNTGVRIKISPGWGGYVRNIYVLDVIMTGVKIAIRFISEKVKVAGLLDGIDGDSFLNICLYNISLSVTSGSPWNCFYIQGYSDFVSPKTCEALQEGIYRKHLSDCYCVLNHLCNPTDSDRATPVNIMKI